MITLFRTKSLPLIFFLNLFFILYSSGNNLWKNIQFDHITVEQGLSQNSVKCIVQDVQGFMWFGTYDGLNKYDGYEFEIFRNSPLDSNSLSHNSITDLIVDSLGAIWVGTVKGLNRYDPVQGRFYRYDTLFVNSLCLDSAGNLWVGREGLDYYSVLNNFSRTTFFTSTSKLESNYFTSLLFQSPNIIWLGSLNGKISLFDATNKKILPFEKQIKIFTKSGDKRISDILEDHKGNIWIGTHGGGLLLYQPNQKNIIYLMHNPQDTTSISSNMITCLFEDDHGNIWVGSQNGLNLLDPNTLRFFHFKHDPQNPSSLSGNKILSIYQDRFGTYWVGTKSGGINKFTLQKVLFQHYLPAGANQDKEAANKVWSFCEDESGDLWVGTSAGLFRAIKNKVSAIYSSFQSYPIRNERDLNCSVRAISAGDSCILWLALARGGLARFCTSDGKIVFYYPTPEEIACFESDLFYKLFPKDMDNFWVGTNGCGLLSFNKKSGKFHNFWYKEIRNNKLDGWIISIYKDRQGSYWFGTWDEGLIQLPPHSKKPIIYRHTPQITYSISNNTIFSIYEDGQGNLWVGTYGGGLNKLNPHTGHFQYYTEKNGLANNVIYGILADDNGYLWMSTNKGLSCFNPQTEQFLNFDVNDGLQGNEFNLGAYYKSRDGTLFFGGNNGFNCFKPREMINNHPPEVVFTGLKKFGKPVPMKPSLHMKKIVLSYKDNFFTIQFTALHYKNPSKNSYAYKLEGFDKDWNYIGQQRQVSFTNLDPGDYLLHVKAANCDGIWSKEGATLSILITPPFWKTMWFYFLTGFLFLGTLLIFHQFRLRAKVHQAILIEKIRTKEKQEIQKSISQDFHDELGHRLTKIGIFCDLLKRELQETSPTITIYLNKIIENAKCIDNETREFIWQVDPEKNTLYHLIVHLKEFSDQLFDHTNISFQIVGLNNELEKITLPIDWRVHLIRIFKEAMHNILRHAQPCQNVFLKVHLKESYLKISLMDDGVGFKISKIKSGNGLANMKKRAEKIGGKLFVSSFPGKGTEVNFVGKLP